MNSLERINNYSGNTLNPAGFTDSTLEIGTGGEDLSRINIIPVKEASKILKQKKKYRIGVFKTVQRIFHSKNVNLNSQKAIYLEEEMSDAQKIETMSQIDEHFFCDDVFRKIYQICFNDVDDGEEISRHIMARVLAGESINTELEKEQGFIFDERDEKVEELLKNIMKTKTVKGLFEKKRLLKRKSIKILEGVDLESGGFVENINYQADSSKTIH